MSRTFRWVMPALLASACSTTMLHGQWQANTGPSGAAMGAVVGGDVERYVRTLAIAGIIKPLPWAARPFGRGDLAAFLRDSSAAAHPWSAAVRRNLASRASAGGMLFLSANSGFPWGMNDGSVWQGRGVTAAAGGTLSLHWGPLTAVAAPVVFSAQNASFPLLPQTGSGFSPYADPQFPSVIDLPQRMGNRSYTRFDGGESSLRLEARGVVVGLTTASAGWGTGEAFPALLGANAGGFPHLFVGTTGRGLRVPYLGRLSGRYILGTLDQTQWSPVKGSETYVNAAQSGTRRIGTGLSVSWQPALLSGLELGASRFYHSPFLEPARRWDAWSKPFEGLFKKNFGNRSSGTPDPTGDADNQLASFFARWAFPKRGVEATFEIFREDHNWDSRDLAQQPENNSARMASIRAITHRGEGVVALATLEYFDGDVRPIAQVRPQGFIYTHAGLFQGHTQRGQLLGSPLGAGAIAGQRVSWERFTADGSIRANLQRLRTRSIRTQYFDDLIPAANYEVAGSHDWIIDGSFASTRYRGGHALTLECGMAWAGNWQLDFGQRSRTNFYARSSWSIF